MQNVFGKEVVKDFKDYETFDEFQIPWGNTVCCSGGAYDEFHRSMLDGINYLRNTSAPMCHWTEISEKYPTYNRDEVYEFIEENAHRARIINRGEYRVEQNSDGYIGKLKGDYTTKADLPYGFTDVIMYFEYNTALRVFVPQFNMSALNSMNTKQSILKDTLRNTLSSDYLYTRSSMTVFRWLRDNGIFDKFEFIPVYVNEDDGVHISHRAYGKGFRRVDEFTSPTLGVNILKHPEIMERLKDWSEQGGKIKKSNAYILLESRDDRSKLYLKKCNIEREE